MQVKDLVDIKKDNFFNGAVQAEWFYNETKRDIVAKSYIFHGPKYYGVSSADIGKSNHKLCDTASFTNALYNKIYNDTSSSRFALTIAGYGAGKSHLSLALATLLSGVNKSAQKEILNNIEEADIDSYKNIKKYVNDKHFVIVLNGINDFNLNREILKVSKQTLKLYGLDDSIFDDMTNAYRTAKNYLESSFEYLSTLYIKEAKIYPKYNKLLGKELKEKILINIEKDYEAYDIVNKVYKSQIGNEIRIDEGVSASSVLNRIYEVYVKKEKKFKSVVILFDEFGRYLEFASSQPGLAGETGIQQIFESVQNSSPNMIFIGFIQSDLNAYMARVNNDNIIRYVGRYQNSDKYYLSSNLETVLASIITTNGNKAEDIISNIFDNTLKNYSNKLFSNTKRWVTNVAGKSVWTNQLMFSKTILKGCYPMHPLTVALMGNLSDFMQQRSTLSFLSDIFSEYKDKSISSSIPFIYPAALIQSNIIYELINAEERGRTGSQICSQYKEIIGEHGETLNSIEMDVLASILVTNLMKFKLFDKNDCIDSIRHMLPYDNDDIIMAINALEEKLGIVFYDDSKNRYMFMNEGNSKIDFNKEFSKYRILSKKDDLLLSLSDEIKKDLKLEILEPTAFGLKNNIVTNEWNFERIFIDINDFTESYATNIKNQCEKANHPDEAKGKVIYLYVTENNYSKIDQVSKMINKLNYDKLPILIGIINDVEGIIFENLLDIKALRMFTTEKKEKFGKFYIQKMQTATKLIVRTFTKKAAQKQFIEENNIVVLKGTLNKEMEMKFSRLYNKTVPFSIDGFEKKLSAKSRRYYNSIIENLVMGKIEDSIEFNNISIDIKNRINSIFSINSEKSWKVLYNGNVIGESQHEVVNYISKQLYEKIKSKGPIKVNNLIDEYMKIPYGLNIYSASLIIIYVIVLNKDNIKLTKTGIKKRLPEILEAFNDEKKERFTELNKYEIQYTEETERDKLTTLIDKIERTRNVPITTSIDLYKELKQIDEVEVSAELRGRYHNCKNILDIAYNKNNEIENKLNTCKRRIKEINSNPFVVRGILSGVLGIKEGTIENMSYMYSLEQVNKSNEIRKEAIDACRISLVRFSERAPLDMKDEFMRTFKNTINSDLPRINAIELIEDFEEAKRVYEKRYNQYARIKEFLNSIESKITEVSMNIKLGEKLEKSKLIIEESINEIEKLTSNDEKLNSSKSEFNKLRDKIEVIELRVRDIENNMHHELQNINNIHDLKVFQRKMISILSENLPKEYIAKVRELENNIVKLLEEVSIYENRKNKTDEIEKYFGELRIQYLSNICFNNIISRIKASLLDRIKDNEERWINNFILAEKQIESMTIAELMNWEQRAQLELEYLSNTALELYEETKVIVNEKISKSKIDNIVAIFDQLSIEEKSNCIEILKSNM